MSWLSNHQVEEAINRLGDNDCCLAFKGVYPIDLLPELDTKPPHFIILNTDSHNLPGQHWKVLFIDENYCGEVFDSLALPLSDSVIRFMNKHSRKWIKNSQVYQHPLSMQCGVYVVYYVTQRLYYSTLHEFCKTFSLNVTENERLIAKFYKQ